MLDDLVRHRILDAVRNGVSRNGAADAARVGRSTLMEWLARGRDGEDLYAEFLEELREAEAGAERTIVDQLFESAKSGHVGAMCFWLERRRPADWGQKREAANDDVGATARDAEASGDLAVAESVVAALKSRRVG